MDAWSFLTKFDVLPPRPIDNQNGLLGWWTFDDGTATDWSGNGNNGALVASPIPVGGIIGGALKFTSSSSQYVNFSSSLDILKDISIMAWINATTLTSQTAIYAKWSGSASTRQFLFETNGSAITMATQAPGGGAPALLTGTSVLTTGVWIHVAVTKTAAGAGVIYINGILNASGGVDTTLLSTATAASIGASVGENSKFFNGTIDDVRIYNRALSASEINAIYNQGIAYQQGYPENEMPLLWYPVIRGRSFAPAFLG